jgi:DNA-binding Lrp family transcriptional regulator
VDAIDRMLLDRIQVGVPLVPRPFAELGGELGLVEAELVARLVALWEVGILRQISGIFDTARLGYRSALVAATVAPERLEAATGVINAHPGVSHNYERDGAWNLWFTLAVPPSSRLGLDATAARLAARAGCERFRLLPALRIFKIGVRLDMDEGGGPMRQDAVLGAAGAAGDAPALDEADRTLVRALQEPLAFVGQPFTAPARVAGLSVPDLLARAQDLLESGVMRRFAGLLHHRRAGFTANAMGVWAVPEARIEEIGTAIATFRAVSHCYQRPTYPDWPYSLFSMVHARSREECLALLDAIAAATGVAERAALWTVREFKKVRLRYFTPDYDAWERAA